MLYDNTSNKLISRTIENCLSTRQRKVTRDITNSNSSSSDISWQHVTYLVLFIQQSLFIYFWIYIELLLTFNNVK